MGFQGHPQASSSIGVAAALTPPPQQQQQHQQQQQQQQKQQQPPTWPRFGETVHGSHAAAQQPTAPSGALQQPEAARLCPPGGHIWRCNKSGAWSSHLKPFPRTSRSWAVYGHREAALMCLRDMWKNYLTSSGLTTADCPVEGLFDNAPAPVLPEA